MGHLGWIFQTKIKEKKLLFMGIQDIYKLKVVK